jgi:serine/threonine protein kinase
VSRSDEAIPISSKEYFSKQALKFHDEILQQVDMPANEALRLECEKLQADTTGAFVQVLSTGTHENYFYYRMPLLTGQSLKELAVLTDAVLFQLLPEIFNRLAELVDRLSESKLHYHGNLQPDSILITRTDAVLLSPGLFDANIDTVESTIQLTTPAYYPFFEPNDVFALGCILWELICKKHPLAVMHKDERMGLFAPDMREMLAYRKALNHEPICNFSRLKTPIEVCRNLADSSDTFLMKAIKLCFDREGYITGDPGFRKAKELSEALEKASKFGFVRAS